MNHFHKPAVKVTTTGIGFPGLLTLLFIALKLTGHIDWGWAWVLSPLWITWGIALFLVAVAGLVFLIAVSRKSGQPKNG